MAGNGKAFTREELIESLATAMIDRLDHHLCLSDEFDLDELIETAWARFLHSPARPLWDNAPEAKARAGKASSKKRWSSLESL